jgi:hypothetical protein
MKNNLGVEPEEWFINSITLNEYPPSSAHYASALPSNPLDKMPIATNKYHPDEDYAPSEYESPYVEGDWFIENAVVKKDYEGPLYARHPDLVEEEESMHEKMYRMAIENHNPWTGGSENFQGGSENINGN